MYFVRSHFFGRVATVIVVVFMLSVSSAWCQSTLQDRPTPITQNEITGTIKPRDIGDSRITTHYYWFDGSQGDVFINLTSRNFAGDVDVFVQSGQRPLTKIVVYADFGEVETGRVIYLRKSERLILRVQGRTPNDEAATYRIKFAGSFVAAVASEKNDSELPTVGNNLGGPVSVNSVGTILPPLPKPAEPATEIEASGSKTSDVDKTENQKIEDEKRSSEATTDVAEKKETPKLEVVVEELPKSETITKTTLPKPLPRRKRPPNNNSAKKAAAKPEKVESAPDETVPAVDKTNVAKGEDAAPPEPAAEKPKSTARIDPLASVQLVIVFKDGRKIERPLPEVFRFSVDRGVLTVISKDGRVGKYQMVDVAKVTIE